MPKNKYEQQYIERVSQFAEEILLPHKDSALEGFEYFGTSEYKEWLKHSGEKKSNVFFSNGFSGFMKLIRAFGRNISGVFKGQKQNFTDLEDYIDTLENTGYLPQTPKSVVQTFPNRNFWSDLKSYAWDNHRCLVGFTELPSQYIFQGKAVLFRYALVFVQEMRKEPIELAPKVDAGVEVITVYNSLGQATNDIARWLRENYGVVCMANHPLGGLVDTTPLAEKAGLGAIGHSGLLITPEFGPRCRISPIFVDQKIFEFTDSREHDWVEDFCDTCHRCERGCPQKAILPDKRVTVRYQSEFKDRTETIDREKCYVYFSKTMGCALCIKNCPFSKNPARYGDRKLKFTKTSSAA